MAPQERNLNKKRANLLSLKRMLANIVHHVSYSRLELNGFYFNFRLRESEKKYWFKQIKLFPVEGQVMTGRTLSNPFGCTAVLAGRCRFTVANLCSADGY